jgi:hypothetical protein
MDGVWGDWNSKQQQLKYSKHAVASDTQGERIHPVIGSSVVTSWPVQPVLPVLRLLAWQLVLELLTASACSRPPTQPIPPLLRCQYFLLKTNCSFVFSYCL